MNESAGELLDLLRSGRAATRADLRRLTGMSRTAVGAVCRKLLGAAGIQVFAHVVSIGAVQAESIAGLRTWTHWCRVSINYWPGVQHEQNENSRIYCI